MMVSYPLRTTTYYLEEDLYRDYECVVFRAIYHDVA